MTDRPLRLGVAYYPECWPEQTWKKDIERMAAGGINSVRLAEFAWGRMETDEGVFDFDWLERFVELAASAGIETMMCTPTEAPPPWLVQKYPDSLPVDADGLRRGPGGRRHYCVNHPAIQDGSDRITEAMGRRFGDNPHVFSWQLDNEAGCHGSVNCYCEHCVEGFRNWLAEKYGTVGALNAAWYTDFWSHTVYSFDQVIVPTHSRVGVSPQLLLDWKRFGGAGWIRFLDRQIEILRPLVGGQEITHNITWYIEEIDMYRLNEKLDFVGIDIYQREPAKMSMVDSWFGAIKPGRKHWVMEMPSGIVDGMNNRARPLPPEKHRSYFLRHYLRGAEGCSMWHFHRHPGGQEMFLGACLDWDGSESPSYQGVKQVGQILKDHGEILAANSPVHHTAILHSYDDLFIASQHGRHLGLGDWDYLGPSLALYDQLQKRQVNATFARPSDDLSQWPVVWAPQTYILTDQRAEALRNYVENGGILIASGQMGLFDQSGKAQTTAHPAGLSDLFGARYRRIEEAQPDDPLRVEWADGSGLQVDRGLELIPLSDETKVLAQFVSHRLAGLAAVTARPVGKGLAILVGVESALPDSAEQLIDSLLAGTPLPADTPLPDGLEKIEGDKLIGWINTTEQQRIRFDVPGEQTDILTGQTMDQLDLAPFETVIFQR
ncbi:MAG: beta-galactosidase [Planctomycetota bacterium]